MEIIDRRRKKEERRKKTEDRRSKLKILNKIEIKNRTLITQIPKGKC
jgi:hypothetical protein